MAVHGEPVLYSLYIYEPNKIAPIVFAVLYGIAAVFHIWQCHRYKIFKLAGLQPVCAVMFTVGYAFRAYGSHNYLYQRDNKTPLIIFILSQVFIYVCPPLLELANYHTLGRIFHYIPHHATMPAGRVLATFGGLMAAVELLNALGVALSTNPSSAPTSQKLGADLVVSAICIQIAMIATFAVLAGIFHRRLARESAVPRLQPVRTLLLVLYGSMALITTRCVYRLVEHLGPSTHGKLADGLEAMWALSPLLRYEAFFLTFESGLMLLNSVLWNVWNPGRFLPRGRRVHLGRDGVEIEGGADIDERPLIQKTAHVLSFGILFGRKSPRYTAEMTEYQSQRN